MNDLRAQILAQIDKDEQLANGQDEQAHAERHWPDRIHRQAAALRKILALHETRRIDPSQYWPSGGWLCSVCSPWQEGEQVYADVRYDGEACPTVLAIADIYEINHS